MREEAGKRTLPKTPPLPLLVPVRFVMPDGSTRGNKSAPAVIDLRRGELRIPSYGVAQRLRARTYRRLKSDTTATARKAMAVKSLSLVKSQTTSATSAAGSSAMRSLTTNTISSKPIATRRSASKASSAKGSPNPGTGESNTLLFILYQSRKGEAAGVPRAPAGVPRPDRMEP